MHSLSVTDLVLCSMALLGSWDLFFFDSVRLSLATWGALKTLESPLDCKEIQPVHSEGDQPWDFFGRNDAKAETPVLFFLYILVSSVKNKVPIGAWVYFWAFYLVPLIYISVFVPVLYSLDDCSFVV